MKYLVTGATGFVGRQVAEQLLRAGHDVVALARSMERARPLTEAGVEVARGDISDRASIMGPMRHVDGVFHVAGWYKIGARDKRDAFAVNVEGTRNVLEVMRELGVQKGVYTSSLAAFSDTHGRMVDESYFYGGPHLSVYDYSKWLAHYEVALPMIRAGLPLVIVQPGAVYGPGDFGPLGAAIRQFLQGKLPIVPRGAAYCWGHVEDTANGHLLAMDKGRVGETYIIAGPPHTLQEFLSVLAYIAGVTPPRLTIPPALLKALAAIMGAAEHVLPIEGSYSSEAMRLGAGVTYLASNEKARKELGLHMRPIEEGLRESFPWYRKVAGLKQ